MMRFGSGTYNVRDSEIMPNTGRGIQRTIICTVFFLDGNQEDFELERHARGQELFDKVCEHLELIEKDYFGLQFVDLPPDSEPEHMRWLEGMKSIRKQMLCPPYLLYFRVKFYVSDPSKLQEEYTRYHFYLQLRKDILEGRLVCPESSAALLGSYAAQSEFGDYSPEEHGENYLDAFQIAPNQTTSLIRKIMELHQLHGGQTPADAEFNFLDHAKRLEMYGLDLYSAKDSQLSPIQIGVTSFGVVVFQNYTKINTFSWAKIMKLSFKRKQFFLQLKGGDEDEKESTVIGFNTNSTGACKYLWKSCIEHHTFFRLIAPPQQPPKLLFSLGSRYRYSGRTEYQTLEEMKRKAKIERTFHRSGSKLSFARSTITGSNYSSAAGTPVASPFMNGRMKDSGFVRNYTSLAKGASKPNGNSLQDRLSRSWSAATGAVTRAASHEPKNSENGTLLTNGHGPGSPRETTFGVNNTATVLNGIDDENVTEHSFELPQRPTMVQQHKPRINGHVGPPPRPGPSSALLQRSSSSTASPVYNRKPQVTYVNGHHTNGPGPSPLVQNGSAGSSSQRSSVASRGSVASLPHSQQNGGSPHHRASPKRTSPTQNGFDDGGLVVIRMKPDAQGRFGFNVKGGSDQNHPIIVSRVAPGSPAELCYPRLNEGDQVLMINARDVTGHTHDQAVRFIRAARENHSGELLLTVRPNVYVGEDIEEPDFQYVPETPHVAECVPRSDFLDQSVLLLKDSLSSGAAVAQFEQLYRKKPGLTMNVCRLAENLNKNRYRDVSPYDATRVVIQKGPSGDYINGNFVNMEVASSGIVNRYIAAQGPLPHTTADFWHVVWEQLCSTVVMLTTTIERGRTKCHQYWPRLYEVQDLDYLQVTCLKEKETASTAFREFSIVNKQTKEERQVSQMQYIAWPDHGVPDDPKQFIDFVLDVRKYRAGSVEPVLVHCSAGIGRTGVLILMETAMCLIEANEPIYPLDIVRTMRDQRGMLIQNSSQYKFVCEAIMTAYKESIIKPLAEYCTKR